MDKAIEYIMKAKQVQSTFRDTNKKKILFL